MTARADDRPTTCGQFQLHVGRLFLLSGHLTLRPRSPTPPLRRRFRSSLRCSIDDRYVVPQPESNVRVPNFDGLHRRFHRTIELDAATVTVQYE